MTRCGDGHSKFDISRGVHLIDPIFQGREVVGGRRSHWKERCWFPIGSPLWTLPYLWPFSHNLPSNVCDAQFDRGWPLLVNILGCSLRNTSVMLESAEIEHSRLSNREIICEDFQLMWSRYLNVTDIRTDGRLCRSNTAFFVAPRGKNKHARLELLFGEKCRL